MLPPRMHGRRQKGKRPHSFTGLSVIDEYVSATGRFKQLQPI
jgi:hypothetical protein